MKRRAGCSRLKLEESHFPYVDLNRRRLLEPPRRDAVLAVSIQHAKKARRARGELPHGRECGIRRAPERRITGFKAFVRCLLAFSRRSPH